MGKKADAKHAMDAMNAFKRKEGILIQRLSLQSLSRGRKRNIELTGEWAWTLGGGDMDNICGERLSGSSTAIHSLTIYFALRRSLGVSQGTASKDLMYSPSLTHIETLTASFT